MRETMLRAADQGVIAILAAAGGVFLVLGALFLAAWSDHYSSKTLTLEKVVARMRELAGPDAADCGQVELMEDPGSSMRCVEAAIREDRPFFVIRRNSFHPGHRMELHWFGFARNRLGQQIFLTYYPPGAIGTGHPGSLRVKPCPRIQSRLDGGEPGPTCIFTFEGKRYAAPPYWYRESSVSARWSGT